MKSFLLQLGQGLWPVFKRPLLISFVALMALAVTIPIFTYIFFARTLESEVAILNQNNSGITLLDRNNSPFFTFYEAKQKKYEPLSDIPVSLQHAAVASEDREFYTHKGFSIKGIIRAFLTNVKSEGIRQGGSTITQQLVKNALLTQQRTFLRKYQEIVLAQEIERRYNKQQILEMYLNTVYFGEGAFGAEQAAETYFNKPAKDLTLAESSYLIGLLPAPSAFSPFSSDGREAKQRQELVLQEMVDQNYITPAQQNTAQQAKLAFSTNRETINDVAPHFALMVRQQLIDKYGEEYVIRSGFQIKTTLDLNWQTYAEQVVKNQVAQLRYNRATNGAAIVMDPTNGDVKALVGSADWNSPDGGKFNIATAQRQPGSSFKPLMYGEAIDERLITAATVLQDVPTTFPGNYKPKDYDGKYRGSVTARRALSNSLNIPAVEVMQKLGVESGVQAAERMGISTLGPPSDYGLSLVLGAASVRLLDLTDAYAAFANGGTQFRPNLILEIKDKFGNKIYSPERQSKQVISPEAAYIISSILSDNNTRQEEFGNALTISRLAAVKTGTTEDFRDALTLGYTPHLVVGVWVGNNDNSPMDNIAGSLGAAPIWRQLMERFLAGTPAEEFPKPADIQETASCSTMTVKDGDKNKTTTVFYKEYFLPGTAPADCSGAVSPTGSITPTPTPNLSPSLYQTPTSYPQDTNTPTPKPTQEPTATPNPTATPMPQPTQTPAPTSPQTQH